jgi:hypothetical protein
MNHKEKRNIEINWAFVILASLLSFFINIVASSVFDIYANGFRSRVFALFIIFLVGSGFFMGFLSYAIENMEKFREESLSKLLLRYVKHLKFKIITKLQN